jgi:hypothetical protein
MKTFQSTPITFIDQTDSRKLEVYIKSNLPTVQIYNGNSGAYTPDWTEGEKLVLSMDVFLDSRTMTTAEYNVTAIKWYKNDVEMSDGSIEDISDDKRKITIKDNILKDNAIITYTCEATYQGIVASTRITFTRVDTGLDGQKGADGTSVRILGNAKSVSPVSNTSYYTITYDAGAVVAAALGDAYVCGGELYVCSVLNGGQDGSTDYFVNVGAIQGEAAKSLSLIGNAQVFRIDKEDNISPSSIDIAAHTVNFTDEQKAEIQWEYRTTTNGTWSSITSYMVSVSNNIAKIDGNAFKGFAGSDFISIRATFIDGEETYQDVFTVYKTFDGIDGAKGDTASMAFLTNENTSFPAGADGKTNVLTTFRTNVVAYNGTEKITPTVGSISDIYGNLPEGMSVTPNKGTAYAKVELIANNAVISDLYSDKDTKNAIDKSKLANGDSFVVGDYLYKYDSVNKNFKSNTTTVDGTTYLDRIVTNNEVTLLFSVSTGKNLGKDGNAVGEITIPITSPVSTNLLLSWTKINAGPEGEPGVGIERIDVDYGSSKTSDVKVEDIVWSDTLPVVPEGEYLWTRTTINYTDSKKQDTVTYTYVQQGKRGDTGTFVDDADIQYAAGSNATTPPSSGWSTAIVATTTDKQYLWTKTIFKLSDGTAGDPVYSVAKQGVDGSNFRTFTTEYETNQTSMETWSKMESSEWNVNESTSGTKVGDTVMLRCYNTTKQGYSYILVTVISIPGDKVIHAKSMGLLDKGDPGTDAYTVLLTNESHVFVGGATSAIAGEASTQVLAYIGASAQPVTIITVNGVAASTNETNTNVAGLTFKCNMLSGNSPTITFKCTTAFVSPSGTIPIKIKVGNLEFTKMFTYAIAFKGSTGSASSSYWLVSNASAVQKTSSGDILCTPATLTFTGRIQTGTSAPTNYAGRWILAYSTDGSIYTDSYTSTANEATASIAASSTYKAVRARMYLAGGTTALLDEQIIPFVSDGETGAPGATGDNAVTFQVYSNNGYALSTSVPTITLQTFAYIGDIEIKSGATYQWYRHNNTDWVAVSGATNAYFNISRDDVSFSNNYMCKMQFNGAEYVGVVTIEDKNDENRVFASKPSNYFAGDLWIVGTDYTPGGYTIGTMLRAEHTNVAYTDSDWVPATKYDEEIEDLKTTVESYKQYFSVNSTNGLQIGNSSINNDVLTTNRVETSIINSDVANVETINVTGRYSGSTMLQAPILNLGNFSFVIEGNGSLSIVANT